MVVAEDDYRADMAAESHTRLGMVGWMLGVLLLLYAVAGWPLAVLVGWCWQHEWLRVARGLAFIHAPHLQIAYHSERYYEYLMHGMITGFATPHAVPGSWEEFRKHRDAR